MTPRNHFLVLVVSIFWVEGTSGAAFSKVIVQRDGVIPLEYFTYDPSSFSYGTPQAAQLSTPPLESVVQAPSVSAIVTPCLAPCIIPNNGQGLTPISSPTIPSNAKIITYSPSVPNVPVVVTNKEAARGYQYAYAVYDDQTRDKKSQSEQSDGSVVNGQYSFIQPDGFRREVVYTADDLKGFNAVVRNISPEPEQPKERKVDVIKPQQAPCPDPQNAQLSQTHEQNLERTISEFEHLQEPKSVQGNDEISVENIEEKVVKNPEEKAKKAKPREDEPIENHNTAFIAMIHEITIT
ncbi:uncharacterized protein LOC123866726 [Maniola jurtina]|uniref:uncharacterized protein LOC123866726 n=1 Tax=Maniola jurtina TaxID=191418 RepID=UPI001E68C098|nr:uncharacterized protein LOC123866726 [Maniola jurtina]